MTSVRSAVRWTLDDGVARIAIGRLARRGDPQGRLLMTHEDSELFALFEDFRARGPVQRGGIGYVTTSHAGVRQVLSSPEFRVGVPGLPSANPVLRRVSDWAHADQPISPITPPALLAVDPPEHTRYRKLVSRAFTPRSVAAMRDRTRAVAAGLLDELDGGAEVDLVARYCTLLPVTVIAGILGVPAEERDQVLAFGEGAAPSLDFGLGWRRFRHVESSLRGFEDWLRGHVRRLRRDPGDDLLSTLIQAQDEQGGLSEGELLATAGLVLAAGFETTVNLLGNGVVLLTQNPDQLSQLLAGDASWGGAVDEILRLDPPVLLTARSAAADTTVDGVAVRAGSFVTAALAAANRDPAVFADPTRFDVTRVNAGDHVSFSGGRHFCLGAALARMEGEVGLSMLFERYPGLTVRPGARRRDTRILRGWATLPVALRSGPSPTS